MTSHPDGGATAAPDTSPLERVIVLEEDGIHYIVQREDGTVLDGRWSFRRFNTRWGARRAARADMRQTRLRRELASKAGVVETLHEEDA